MEPLPKEQANILHGYCEHDHTPQTQTQAKRQAARHQYQAQANKTQGGQYCKCTHNFNVLQTNTSCKGEHTQNENRNLTGKSVKKAP